MADRTLSQLEQLRQQIDAIDAEIVETLGRRFELCRKIAHLKKNQSIPMMQHGRVDAVKKRCMELGLEHGLDPKLVNELYRLIIDQSCQVEDDIIEGGKD